MAKQYEAEFKNMIVQLVHSDTSVRQISEDYNLNDSMVRRWRREYESRKEGFTGHDNISLTPEEKELADLRAELKETQLERNILKKAVNIFSRSGN